MNHSDPIAPKRHSILQRTAGQVLGLIEAVTDGFRLGLLKPETMFLRGQRTYGAQAFFQSEAHNRSGLHGWELRAVETHFSQCRRWLVAAAGCGREVLALRKRDCEADGFECHPVFVELANRLLVKDGFPASVRLAPPDECVRDGGKYDALLVGMGAYVHIQTRDKRIAFLRQMRALARDGTPLLLSFFLRVPDARRFAVTAWIGNLFRRLLARPRLEAGDTFKKTFFRLFTPEEITEELTSAGFELVAFDLKEFPYAVAKVRGNHGS